MKGQSHSVTGCRGPSGGCDCAARTRRVPGAETASTRCARGAACYNSGGCFFSFFLRTTPPR
eukprot:scaffold4263_cov101-Isochrysis_galbana.AAC.4